MNAHKKTKTTYKKIQCLIRDSSCDTQLSNASDAR